LIINKCDEILDKYLKVAKKADHTKMGVTCFEGLAFCAYCEIHNIDVIVESGTASGKSAKIWARYFPDKTTYTIDNVSHNIFAGSNLPIIPIIGNGFKVLPRLIKDLSGHIAVFIDGPKGKEALKLATELLKNDKVKFVAIDDLGKNSTDYKHWVGFKGAEKILNTSDGGYIEKYSHIDKELNNPDPRPHGIGFLQRKQQKTVAFDLDDTLCTREQQEGGPEKYFTCKPTPEMIKIMNECYDYGHKVKVYTARGMTWSKGRPTGLDVIREISAFQLMEWGAKYHELILGKTHFELLIDDKVANSEDIHSFQDIQDRL